MRVFNWMLDKDETDIIGFLGSVGDKGYLGEAYKNLLLKEKIIPIFETIAGKPTGLCIVMCCNKDRAHLTDLGASNAITDKFVEENWNKFEKVKLIYTELFIIKMKKDICYKLAQLGLRDETLYGFNLPSEYFLNTFTSDISNLCEYADIIFANKFEGLLFAKLLKIKISNENSVEEIALQLNKNIQKKNKNKSRIVIVTHGPHPAACCEYDHKEKKVTFLGTFEVRDVPQENIIDTNGAGDSFAGGFLSQLVKGKKLDECMKAGHWAASIIIQKRGCQIPVDIKY
jgi:adenosine kinase